MIAENHAIMLVMGIIACYSLYMKLLVVFYYVLASLVVATESAEKESSHSLLSGVFSPKSIDATPLIVVLKTESCFSKITPRHNSNDTYYIGGTSKGVVLEVLKGDIPKGMRFSHTSTYVDRLSRKPTEKELQGEVSNEVYVEMYMIEHYKIEDGHLIISELDNLTHIPQHIGDAIRQYLHDQKK